MAPFYICINLPTQTCKSLSFWVHVLFLKRSPQYSWNLYSAVKWVNRCAWCPDVPQQVVPQYLPSIWHRRQTSAWVCTGLSDPSKPPGIVWSKQPSPAPWMGIIRVSWFEWKTYFTDRWSFSRSLFWILLSVKAMVKQAETLERRLILGLNSRAGGINQTGEGIYACVSVWSHVHVNDCARIWLPCKQSEAFSFVKVDIKPPMKTQKSFVPMATMCVM